MRGVFSVFFSLCVACTDLGGLSGGADDAPPPRGSADAARGADCNGDGCLPSPENVVYVAEDGNDSNAGTKPDAPKRTIGGAIALLQTIAAPNYEVHVCRGTYRESVVLDFTTSILGGFECSTWKRNVAGNATVVVAETDEAALTVKGVSGVTVSGLTLRAGDAANARSRAVHVLDAASVVLADDVLAGGGGKTKLSPASVGLLLDGGSAEVRGGSIDGGSATNESGGYGSAGIFVAKDPSELVVSNATVRGGSGTVSTGTGSVAILSLGGNVRTVEKTKIEGGTGKATYGSSTVGVLASTTKGDLDFVGNVVDGGAGSCTSSCGATGASLSAKGSVRVRDNRIFGGEVSAPGQNIRFRGLAIADAASADVQNNQIFTGNTQRALADDARAFESRNVGTLLLAQNTLVLGPTVTGAGGVAAISGGAAAVANNLFVAAGGWVDYAVRVDSCKSAKVTSFRNNVWAGFPDGKPLVAIDEPNPSTPVLCTAASATASTTNAAEDTLKSTFAGAAIAGNASLAVAPSALFGGWNAETAGDLVVSGWRLGASAPCSVAKGSGDVGGLLATDAYGTARTDPRSIGASESDGACR